MFPALCVNPPTTYHRREPNQSARHGVVREHLGTFLASHDILGHVRRALRRYLDCGVLAQGFVRVRCPQCKAECLVTFSCKDRSFCPSCTARRAAEPARLVDHVLPQVPHRQCVLALPPDLHVRFASDPELESRLLQLFTDELFELQRALARAGDAARGGSVTLLQHFGSSLNLHVHFHTLALDGVYVPGDSPDASPRFVRAPEPTPEQLRWLCSRVVERAARLVACRPWKEPAEERQTQVFTIHGGEPREPTAKRLHARVAGFDLHASAPMEAHERIAIERFARYALRNPIANGCLSRGLRDQLTYRLKAPRPDGTTALALSPMTLLERLTRLIPQHGRHMVTYHGVLASAARYRPRIVPTPPPALPPLLRHAGSRRIHWMNLLRRVFLLEVLACACDGTRRVISSVEEGRAARKILRHLGLPSEAPTPAPARTDQEELFAPGPPPPDVCEPPPVDTYDQRLPPHLDPA